MLEDIQEIFGATAVGILACVILYRLFRWFVHALNKATWIDNYRVNLVRWRTPSIAFCCLSFMGLV